MRKPSASTWCSRKALSVMPWPSDVADAREHLLAEELERAHQRLELGGSWRVQRQVEHAGADHLAAAADLLDDRVRAADERRRQGAAHDRCARLARDVA